MTRNLPTDSVHTVVIGGGQAGLATSYHLRRHGIEHLVLDENDAVGAAWRNRWDSLRLFTPAKYSGLPGLAVPAPAHSLLGKDDVADYLEEYATHFELPVINGIEVDRVAADDGRFVVDCADRRVRADNVVVATGAFHRPRIPAFADSLRDDIVQLHSCDYRRHDQLADGDTLVVGAGQSGAEIALDQSRWGHVWLSGRDPGQEPTRPGSWGDRLMTPAVWFIADKVIDVRNPIGRKVRDRFLDPPRGIPRAGGMRTALRTAGVECAGSTTGTVDGSPQLDDGRVLEVANVVWATGFRPDYGWIDLPVFGSQGYPIHERGVVESRPGLYFMGLLFQTTLSSALIGGMGRDAEHVASHIRNRQSSARVATTSTVP